MRYGFVAAMAALLAAVAAVKLPEARLEGENGLWVEHRNDTLVVHWLTTTPQPGTLEVGSTGAPPLRFETPAGTAHQQAFPRPRTDVVTLRYGARGSTLHQTALSFRRRARTPVAPAADSIFILGDTHGEYDRVVQLLRAAGLINAERHWSAGRAQLVLAGDLMDRGEHVTPLLWLIYRLEHEAAAAGGAVHVVLGNHETMVFTDDLRYVHANDMAVAKAHGVPYPKLFDIRESVLGAWLATKPAVLKLGDFLIAHGGVSTDFLKYTPQTLDDSLAKFMGEELFYRWSDTTAAVKIDSAAYARRVDFFFGPRSVFWFREYVQTDTLGKHLDRVLRRFGARTHIVAHTPTAMVHQKYDGKLIVAHPRTPAIELVLLARSGKNYARFRVDLEGKRTPLTLLR